jgi:ribokinase
MRTLDVIGMGALLVDRIASIDYFPKVDGETFVRNLQVRPGGSAANFAVACKRLGIKSGFIGLVGDDPEGRYLIDDLKKEGVDTSGVVSTKTFPTGQVYIALDREGKRMMFAYSGAANALSEELVNTKYIASSQFLHIADLKNVKPLIAAAKKAQDAETKVSLNPGELISVQGYDEIKDLLSNVDIFVSSRNEVNQIFRTENLEYAIRKVLKSGPEIAVITLGSEGCIAADSWEAFHRIAAFKTEVIDTTGAGDAFCAGLITMLVEGRNVVEAAKFASAVAALKIANLGARSLPARKQVDEFISDHKC